MTPEQRIGELRDQLNRHNRLYYVEITRKFPTANMTCS